MPRKEQEWTLSLDASELAWSGVLDGVVDPDSWPWDELRERSGHLTASGHAAEELALEHASVKVLAPDRVRLRLTFLVMDAWVPYPVGETWAQTLTMQATPCPFGGQRWWFVCPGQGCGERRAKLYRPWADWWACRECYGLTYASRARYSSRTAWSRGRGRTRQEFDRGEAEHERRSRSNMRRSLSRWRKCAREDERRDAWPVQVTTRTRPSKAELQ